MIVASQGASFGLPEVKRGLMAGAGGVHRLANVLPRNIAAELLATGEPIYGVRAHALGLVNRLVGTGETLAAARELAEAIVKNAPLSVQNSLAAMRASIGQPDGAGRAIVSERFTALRKSDDFKEGPRALLKSAKRSGPGMNRPCRPSIGSREVTAGDRAGSGGEQRSRFDQAVAVVGFFLPVGRNSRAVSAFPAFVAQLS